ncbi:uncharacterized protein LOC123718726 isoform X3 [Pieris brassicae]|uniref:uncharacterized protein LOC123718726 isoform X3 n=1 Tax=Pieris brassicae TaxID=7116 RepID=UPI001E65FF54|nr:uncharacterized protein LOC123718726 isoform X3 [Pieris brassicae]
MADKSVKKLKIFLDLSASSTSKQSCSALMEVIEAAMNISTSVMSQEEVTHGACTDIVRAAEEISTHTDNVQGHKKKLAVEHFRFREGLSRVTCVWYSRMTDRRLHCSTTNRTVAPLLTVTYTPIHASVQIPAVQHDRRGCTFANSTTRTSCFFLRE